jgi:hypothetical protein
LASDVIWPEVSRRRVSLWRRLLAFFTPRRKPRVLGLLPAPGLRFDDINALMETIRLQAIEQRVSAVEGRSRTPRPPALPIPGDGVSRLG